MNTPVFEDKIEKIVDNNDVENAIIEIIKQYPPEEGWILVRYPDEEMDDNKTKILFEIKKYENEKDEQSKRTM